MSDKELRLLAAARREVAARRDGAAPDPVAKAAPARAAPVRAAPTSPLDGRTVVGWDSPAANPTPPGRVTAAGKDQPAARGAAAEKGADEKWARIAALMESERAEAMQKRQRAQRRVKYFLGALLVIAALVAARVLLGR